MKMFLAFSAGLKVASLLWILAFHYSTVAMQQADVIEEDNDFTTLLVYHRPSGQTLKIKIPVPTFGHDKNSWEIEAVQAIICEYDNKVAAKLLEDVTMLNAALRSAKKIAR